MKTPSKTNPTFVPFAADSAPRDDGKNSYAAEWKNLVDLLLGNYATFSIRDAYSISRSLDIPPQHILAAFNEWTETLCKAGTLKRIPGCYDEEIFSVETKPESKV